MTNPTTAGRAPRIRSWYLKLAYVVVSCAVVYLVAAIPLAPGGPGILRAVVAFALILLGARVFRGVDEDNSARAWWRMTARVPGGIVLGSICALAALLSATGYVGLATTTTLAHKDVVDLLPPLLVIAILAATLSYLYYGSSWRLAREPSVEAVADEGKGR